MSSLSITDSQLVGLFIEAAAWGIQLVTFVLSVWTLAERARASNLRLMNPLLVYASTLFLIGTLDVSFALIQNLQMFSYDGGCSGDGIPHQPPNYVLTLRYVWNFLSVIIADSALIHRCWVVYSRRWRCIAPPIVLWFGGCALACTGTYYIATEQGFTGNVLAVSFVACAGIVNAYTSTLILYRIILAHRAYARYFSPPSGSTALNGRVRWAQLARILVESALLYTLTGVVVLVASLTDSTIATPTLDLTVQLAGIQFDLIVVRIGRGITVADVEAQTSKREMQSIQHRSSYRSPRTFPNTARVLNTLHVDDTADRGSRGACSGIEDASGNLP